MIVFAHGLEGTPTGAKISALRAAGIDVLAPDGRGLVLAQRIEGLESATRGGGLVLGGSSYGGLAAAWLAQQHPQRFSGLLLCAPALHFTEAPVTDPLELAAPSSLPTIILHGTQDSVVPIDASRAYRERSGGHVELWEVEDDHGLGGSHALLIKAARQLVSL